MLLDQKRTKRLVRITAVITAIAFAGVALVIIAVIILGGGSSPTAEQLGEARTRVEQEPENPAAWDQLAAAYQADGQTPEAIDAARRAVQLAPREFSRTITLVQLLVQADRRGDAIEVMQAFTQRNPEDAEGFFQLGRLAQEEGRVQLAILSYQTYLRLAPDGASADAVRQQLRMLEGGGAAAPPP